MNGRNVVDAHHHLWDLTSNSYPWLQGKAPAGIDVRPFAHDYHVADYLRDASPANVRQSVHVQAGWNPADPVGETRWLRETAQETGYPHAVVAHVDLAAADAADVIAAHASHGAVRGIRMVLTWHPDPRYRRAARADYFRDAAWLRGLSVMADLGLSFDLQIFPSQMAEAERVVARHSGVRFIIDHLGLPIGGQGNEPEVWRAGLGRLAAHDNVAIKLSGFSHFLARWSPELAAPLVEVAWAAFGRSRCLFGSNYPVDRPFVGFARLVEDLAAILETIEPGGADAVFVDNARAWYRLDA